MHFIHGASQENELVLQKVLQGAFKRLHRELSTSESFYASRRDTVIRIYLRISAVKERILSTIQDNS